MLFSSLIFLFVFLPAVLFIYYIPGNKYKNLTLLLFSLFFYGYGEPKYLIVMLISILMNYAFGLMVDRYRLHIIRSRIILVLSVISNLAIIGYFKYTNFVFENINSIFSTNISLMKIVMPIGISFFTFQGLSYVLDIYRQNGKVQKNPLNVALYISLFPQLIAGPIVRYETVAEQIDKRSVTIESFASGIERFIIGLGKKILIANSLGLIADEVFGSQISELSVLLAWIGILAYTAQIYFDFSGYSDMAIGLGRLFGFNFLENFNYPYISTSITEFWRRWHISLGTWFRDYLYIPLGGNKVGKYKHLRNIFIVWFLTGLWHGAAWNFIVWGIYYGIILGMEKYVTGKLLARLWKPLQHLYTLLLVIIGWLLFRSDSLQYAFEYFKVMFGIEGLAIINAQAVYYMVDYKFEFLIAIVASIPVYSALHSKLESNVKSRVSQFILYFSKPLFLMLLLILCTMYLVNSTFNPFIYFRF